MNWNCLQMCGWWIGLKIHQPSKKFVMLIHHNAVTSALEGNCLNKTYQSRLTRWIDRILPYHFIKVHNPGKDMQVVDFSPREPNGQIFWHEIELDARIKNTHGCCSNQNGPKRAKLNRNKNFPNSRLSKLQQNSFCKFSCSIQSVNSIKQKVTQKKKN